MKELLRTNETVFLSWARALLKSDNIETYVLDGHMSILEGSAGAIPRRVMVHEDDYDKAKSLLIEAGEGDRVV